MRLKRGDALRIDGQVLGDGVPIPSGIGAWTIRCQLRKKSGTLVDTLTVSILDAAACTFRMVSSGTSSYPIEEIVGDIEYTISGDLMHTEDFSIDVEKVQTQAVTP